MTVTTDYTSWVNNYGWNHLCIGRKRLQLAQHNVLHHTTNIPGHDDLDAGRIIRFTKEAKWHNFSFSAILLCISIWFTYLQLGYHNRFQAQMKSY
jgi:hypothetical protein